MKQVKLKKVGKFVKTHGVNGALMLIVENSISADLLNEVIIDEGWIFVEINGIPVPFCVSKGDTKPLNDKSIRLKLDLVDNNKAKNLCYANVFINTYYMSNDALKQEDNYDDINGFEVVNKNEELICFVDCIVDIPSNPLISAQYKSKEILIPLLSEYILNIDYDTKQVITDFPENYLSMLQ